MRDRCSSTARSTRAAQGRESPGGAEAKMMHKIALNTYSQDVGDDMERVRIEPQSVQDML